MVRSGWRYRKIKQEGNKMKKYLIFVLAVLTVIATVSCTGKIGPAGPAGQDGTDANSAFTPPSNATILVNENFESYAVGVTPTGWTRATIWGSSVYNPTTNTSFVSYNKSLMVQAISGGGLNTDRQIVKCPGIEDTIPNTLSGKVYITFYANKNLTNKAKGFVFYINQYEKLRVDMSYDGTIRAYTGINTSTSIGAYLAGEWKKIGVILNLTTQKYEVYTDGVLRVKDIPCYDSFEQLNDTSTIGMFDRVYSDFFGILTNQTTDFFPDILYVDDVLIYYVP
jgi:hypothetical protein